MKGVDFINMVTKSSDTCEGCYFSDSAVADNLKCRSIMKSLTGIDCRECYIVFVKKKEYIACTLNNLQVGDIVYRRDGDSIVDYKVEFITDTGKVYGRIENSLLQDSYHISRLVKEI